MSTPLYQQAKLTFEKGGLPAVFLEVLGWDSTPNDKETFLVDNVQYVGTKVASVLSGIVVFEFDFQQAGLVTPSQQKEIAKAVGRKYAERLVVFKTKTKSTWLWPKKTAGGALTFEKLEAPSNSLPTFLAQRLVALSISNEEFDKGVTLPLIREKLRGSFDTSTVTKKFYERFRNQHQELAKAISGLDAEQSHSYATLLLNRLMFIYFLQKKEFLNGDPNYLRNCLSKVTGLKGSGKFFSFYKDLLLELFFEGLNKKDGVFSPVEIASIIGKVPYINGGIFGESELEKSNVIAIPDEVFVDIFNFFDSFTWHLDTRPTGKSDEINPEVIGYIFEQYINFTAGGKKENGAYYTKQDVTGYMVEQTLVPRVLDILIEIGLNPLQLTIGSGDRYIKPSMLHGWDEELSEWEMIDSSLIDAWSGDPSGWSILDESEHNSVVSLPGESLVETFHRREQVDRLRQIISGGAINSANDLITLNLNGLLLLLDAIDVIDNEDDLHKTWIKVSELSVIDPTCGSGAFLFAALEVLEDIYAHLIDLAEELAPKSPFAKNIVNKVNEHANRRYYIRKQASLNNLYGTDLMADAIETAKLRVFLALASCLDSTNEIEPLPDLDFNLKTGNLVVGFRDEEDAYRIGGDQLLGSDGIGEFGPQISQYINLYSQFIENSDRNLPIDKLKTEILSKSKFIRKMADEVYASHMGIDVGELDNWVLEKKPFHWFAEFPQIISRGGFDVIIGNPPYIAKKEIPARDIKEYVSKDSPDFFAVCYERSLQLLSPTGRHSFIVMISLAAGSKFGAIRRIISARNGGEWWSTYGKRPDSLFAGVAVVNTILVLAPTGNKYATAHNIFSKDSRSHLFSCLQYGEMRRATENGPIRGGVVNALAVKISECRQKVPFDGLGDCLYIRGRARYWYPALPGKPAVISTDMTIQAEPDQTVGKSESLLGENLDISIALLGGKIGYLWWSSIGDDFNSLASTSLQPRLLAQDFWADEALQEMSDLIVRESFKNAFGSLNAGSIQVNIRWNAMRATTDKFDRLVLEKLGLLEHWRELNIWYRKCMQAKSENSNSFVIPEGIAKEVFSRR